MSTLHFTTTHLTGDFPGAGQWLGAERAIGAHFDAMDVHLYDTETGNSFEYVPHAAPVVWANEDDPDATERDSTCFLSFAGDPGAWDAMIGQAWLAYASPFEVTATDGSTYRVEPQFFEARGGTFPDQNPPVTPPLS